MRTVSGAIDFRRKKIQFHLTARQLLQQNQKRVARVEVEGSRRCKRQEQTKLHSQSYQFSHYIHRDKLFRLSLRNVDVAAQPSGVQKWEANKIQLIRLLLAEPKLKIYKLFTWRFRVKIDGRLQVASEFICGLTHDRLFDWRFSLISKHQQAGTTYQCSSLWVSICSSSLNFDGKKTVNKSSFNNQINLRLKWEATLNCVRPARSSISIDVVREQWIW